MKILREKNGSIKTENQEIFLISKHTGKGPQDSGCGELYKVVERARELNNIT